MNTTIRISVETHRRLTKLREPQENTIRLESFDTLLKRVLTAHEKSISLEVVK